MADAGEGPPAVPKAPEGPVRYAWFGGILEGRRPQDDGALRAAVAELNADGPVPADLEVEGGRFTVLLGERTLEPSELSSERLTVFVDLLQRLVEASADPERIESTLRCTEVYAREAVETVFAPVAGEVRCVSRVRALNDEDRRRAPVAARPAGPAFDLGTRRALLIGALFLIAFGLFTWRSGIVGRWMSAEAAGLARETGPFGTLLAVEVERMWPGDYRVVLRRGDDYPLTTDAVSALQTGAGSPVELAAVNAVAEGDAVYAQLLNHDGEVLASDRLELRPLLGDADAEVEGKLKGRISAATVRLALDPGTPPR